MRGFTLIELMIVIAIVGIVASTVTPLMAHVVRKARVTEAKTGLGAVRRAMRMYYVEHQTYRNQQFTRGRVVTFGHILPLKTNDLDGRYFSSECYTFESVRRQTFRIRCDGSSSTAPEASRVEDVVLYINQEGDIWTAVPGDETPHDIAIPFVDD
jgi:prepilin-type N-terminal cleavage/methylation domain-containing protein